ncbi:MULTISPECIES: ERF family protein [Enterococcus]|uniref:Single-stranded DNA-binding protein n=1 Tax=Candidatus Enterococcus ferrettii TaxID=2815324 RepID=A0ABV0EZ15_9ENTE|nr:ERF family protein [Enterococcus sp. 665A]MBO1340346.1 ERF family protein [Enterococcus sp. 665A]
MSDTIENPQKNLMNKLVDITSTIDRIPKNGHNDFHHYDYALESDIKDVVRKEMTERGLQMIPNELSRTITQISAKNGSQQLVSLEVEYTIFDAESGESVKMKGYGDGQDSGDKAVYKAKTGALKYALTSLFMIPTGDDPETPLQPPKTITKEQYAVIESLSEEVAELSNSQAGKVIGTLKVELKITKALKEINEDEFDKALKLLQTWKKQFEERQKQERRKQELMQQEEGYGTIQNIPWGQKQ